MASIRTTRSTGRCLTLSDSAESIEQDEAVVPVPVLEALIEGWEVRVSCHDYDGPAAQYRGYMEATDACIEQLDLLLDEYRGDTDDG